MNKFLLIFKKEVLTITRDRKSLITSILLTLLITPALLGGVQVISRIQSEQNNNKEAVIGILEQNQDLEFIKFLDSMDLTSVKVVTDLTKSLQDDQVSGYIQVSVQDNKTNFTYVYDQRSNFSTSTSARVAAFYQVFDTTVKDAKLAQFNLSQAELSPYNFAANTLQNVTGTGEQGSFVLFFLPYIILIGLLQGSLAYAIELTTGEKERNTLATTLGLNVKSSTIAFAKIATVLVFSILFLIINIASIVLSFAVFPDLASEQGLTLTLAMLVQIVVITLPLSVMFSSLLVLLGIYARNQKEGGIYATPLLLLTVFIGVAGNGFDVNTAAFVFAIPVVGHVVALKQALLGVFNVPGNLILFGVTALIFALVVFVTVKMFKREEVLFRA